MSSSNDEVNSAMSSLTITDPSLHPAGNANVTPSLLAIPFELRQQIYTFVFTPLPALTVNASIIVDADAQQMFFNEHTRRVVTEKFWQQTSTLKSRIRSLGLIYTNRQIYKETLSNLLASLHLHQTFDADLHLPPLRPHQPQLSTHLPRKVLRSLRYVTYHIPYLPLNDDSAHQRPCRTPFPFAQTPNLTHFAIRKVFGVSIDVLFDRAALKWLTRAEYEALTPLQRLGVWDRTELVGPRALLGSVARFGSGGWVSRLVWPGIYSAEVVNNDDDNDGDGDDKDRSGLGMPSTCHVTVEAEIRLFAGQGWRPSHIDTLLVEVGVREGRVLSRHFLPGTGHSSIGLHGNRGRGPEGPGTTDLLIPESAFDTNGPMAEAFVRREMPSTSNSLQRPR